jgi:hypothetical protein
MPQSLADGADRERNALHVPLAGEDMQRPIGLGHIVDLAIHLDGRDVRGAGNFESPAARSGPTLAG